MTARLAAFARARTEGRAALITLVVPGYPSPTETDAVFDAMVAGGADIIEVEIPFSDPLADGTTIQHVVFDALQAGITPRDCVEFVRRARSRHPDTPIVFMTYLNPILAYGLERFAVDAATAGADARILTDLPPEEAATAKAALNTAGLDLIFLVAPTSSDERLALICAQAGGFVYCVSVAGVTGARTSLPADLPAFLARVRRCTNLALAVGFGLSRREHIEALASLADGAVVASAILDVIETSKPEERAKAVREYVEVLSGSSQALKAGRWPPHIAGRRSSCIRPRPAPLGAFRPPASRPGGSVGSPAARREKRGVEHQKCLVGESAELSRSRPIPRQRSSLLRGISWAKCIRANDIDKEDVASGYFTTTPDLNAEFPAVAARNGFGWSNVALMCGHEMAVPGSLPMCLRILLHVNTDRSQSEINHIYLRGATILRPDLASAEPRRD